MKYSTEVTIDLPRERIIELFNSFDNLVKWQPRLRSYEHLNRTPSEPGAKTRLRYDEDGREMEMIETVLKRDLPDEFTEPMRPRECITRSQIDFMKRDRIKPGRFWIRNSNSAN